MNPLFILSGMKYHLNIGTNLGERESNLRSAIYSIETSTKCVAEVSSFIETDAWGFNSENKFLNVAVAVDCHIEPFAMLDLLQRIEQSLGSSSHRNEDGSYKDRVVDIDIIAVDEMIINTDSLIIPHPRMHLREFVLKPLAELAPSWKHPVLQKNATQLLKELCKK